MIITYSYKPSDSKLSLALWFLALYIPPLIINFKAYGKILSGVKWQQVWISTTKPYFEHDTSMWMDNDHNIPDQHGPQDLRSVPLNFKIICKERNWIAPSGDNNLDRF